MKQQNKATITTFPYFEFFLFTMAEFNNWDLSTPPLPTHFSVSISSNNWHAVVPNSKTPVLFHQSYTSRNYQGKLLTKFSTPYFCIFINQTDASSSLYTTVSRFSHQTNAHEFLHLISACSTTSPTRPLFSTPPLRAAWRFNHRSPKSLLEWRSIIFDHLLECQFTTT